MLVLPGLTLDNEPPSPLRVRVGHVRGATASAIADAVLATHDHAGHGVPKRRARLLQAQVGGFLAPDTPTTTRRGPS